MTAIDFVRVERRCGSCPAAIFWAVTEASLVEEDGPKSMPIDFEPSKEGNVEIVGKTDMGRPIARVYSQTPLFAPEGTIFVSHFVTCDHADEHRKSR